jgi:hypothetical protein
VEPVVSLLRVTCLDNAGGRSAGPPLGLLMMIIVNISRYLRSGSTSTRTDPPVVEITGPRRWRTLSRTG